MGRLGIIAPYAAPVLADDVRRAIQASGELEVIQRMRRAGWTVETDGRRVVGKRGPKWSTP